MKLVTVEDLKDGDVIANDVLLEDYTVVLGKGTVIKEQYVEKLRDLGIFTVYIEEKAEEKPKAPETNKKPAAKPEAQAKPKAEESKEKKAEEKKPDNRRPKLSMETVTVLRDDVEKEIRNKIKDILELHVYQKTKGLKKLRKLRRI